MGEGHIKGKVVWFNSTKGYGFIKSENGGSDVFFHYTAIAGSGFKTMDENDEVTFYLEDGPKGKQAADVRKIEK